MSKETLVFVLPGMHTREDMEYILQADNAQPVLERIPLADIEKALIASKMQLFRIVPGPGVILTEVRSRYGAKRLSLIRGAGRAAHQMKTLFKLLSAVAADLGCECVETVVYSQRLKRALDLSGASVEGYILTYPAESLDGQ
jgi:hypothetical protein